MVVVFVGWSERRRQALLTIAMPYSNTVSINDSAAEKEEGSLYNGLRSGFHFWHN